MSKYKNVLIIAGVVLSVFVVSFALSIFGPTYIEKISYKEYQEKMKDNEANAFFVGSKNENYDFVDELATSYKADIYYVDEEDLTKDQKEELKANSGKLFIMKNGKQVYINNKEDKKYKLVKTLMNENIIEDNYIEITFDDYQNIIKEKGYQLIFIGSASCGYCTNFKPEIKLTLKEHNANIYYLDISKLSSGEMQALYASDSYYTENEWGTPLNLLFKDGKRINVLNGYVPSSELTSFLKENKVI